MNTILVSVIIPTYNREKCILASIESALMQTYENIEIIIVDDASIDGTEELIKNIDDERIHYIKNNINLGPAETRNIGVKIAKGEYIAFLDSDDVWKNNKLEKQMQKMNENKNYAMCYCKFNHFMEGRSQVFPSEHNEKNELEGNVYKTLLKENKVSTQTMLINKRIFNDIGGFDSSMRAVEDWDLALRISAKYEIAYVDEALVDVYYTEGSVNYNCDNWVDGCLKIIDKNKKFVDNRMFTNIISCIFERLPYCKNNYEDRIVPCIVKNEYEYDIILNSYKKAREWKEKYEVLLFVNNEEEFFQKINNPIIIYYF